MSTITEDLQIGGDGTELITSADGATTDKSYVYLIVNGAATFTTLNDSDDRDMTAAISNPGGCGIDVSIAVGMVIRPKGKRKVKDITLSAGSVFGVLED